jgi:hypothetical protein
VSCNVFLDLDEWLAGLARLGRRGEEPPWGLLVLGLAVLAAVLVIVFLTD